MSHKAVASRGLGYRIGLVVVGLAVLLVGFGGVFGPTASVAALSVSPAISAGGFAVECVLSADATVSCWGGNSYGDLGDGTTANSTIPVVVEGLSDVRQVSAGAVSCAVLQDGQVACWGRNDFGQLGIGTTSGPQTCGGFACSTTPMLVTGISSATAVSSGGDQACALLSDGTVQCWGWNVQGALGDGTTTNSPVPVSVQGLTNAVAISADGEHSCALLADGTVRCWGWNGYGDLGLGTNVGPQTCDGPCSTIPVAVTGVSNATAISNGDNDTCALLADGTSKCWGVNSDGQLGNGTTTVFSATATLVSGLSNAVEVDAGSQHTCALLNDGTARCWGWNQFGVLGDGTTTSSNVPVAVSGLTNAIAITAGEVSCALLADGTAACWGPNGAGLLGTGNIIGPDQCIVHSDTDIAYWCATSPIVVTTWDGSALPTTTSTSTSTTATSTTSTTMPVITTTTTMSTTSTTMPVITTTTAPNGDQAHDPGTTTTIPATSTTRPRTTAHGDVDASTTTASAAPATGTPQLPRTGSDSSNLVLLAIDIALAGTALILSTGQRRRSRTRSQ